MISNFFTTQHKVSISQMSICTVFFFTWNLNNQRGEKNSKEYKCFKWLCHYYYSIQKVIQDGRRLKSLQNVTAFY